MKIGELFDIKYGINLELNACEITSGDDGVNFVARTSENNGVVAKVKLIAGKTPQPVGVITCAGGGSVLSAFVQTKPFYSGRDLYILTPKQPMSLEEKLFYCHAIKMNAYRYGYGRQANKTLKNINLPPLPKWLEDYKIDYSPIITKIKHKEMPIDTTGWGKFNLNNLFQLSIAKSNDFGNLEKGDIPFVGRTTDNNGLQGYVDSAIITKGTCITVSMVGTLCALWQQKDFAASQNILVLRNNKLNKYNALFVSSVINHSIENKYNYNRPIKKQQFEQETIKLPVDKSGNPDWAYMESYIKSLPHGDNI